ncbi:hypothetical protein [Antarctobacter sp.]|uniref:hypothetical protein n=1 Tax=Antarctobacter sp. TaxID=1872577 RepID=UPI003A90DAD9
MGQQAILDLGRADAVAALVMTSSSRPTKRSSSPSKSRDPRHQPIAPELPPSRQVVQYSSIMEAEPRLTATSPSASVLRPSASITATSCPGTDRR